MPGAHANGTAVQVTWTRACLQARDLNVSCFLSASNRKRREEVYVDFITVDSAEDGTGAAPPEISNHIRVGLPLIEGLVLVDSLLVGAGIHENLPVYS